MEEEKKLEKEEAPKVSIAKFKSIKKKKEVTPGKPFGKLIIIILVILALVGIGGGSYFWWQNQSLKKNPNMIAQQEAQQLVEKVEKLMVLPEGETPTIATVSDKEKIKEQAFFKNAENDDKVLIYVKSEKAILYRPSTNKIIGVTSVILDKSQNQNVPASNVPTENSPNSEQQSSNNENTAIQPVKVAIYNGTKTNGLTAKAEEKIKSEMADVNVTAKNNAKKDDYEKTVVADVSGSHSAEAEKIAQALGGEIGQLPDGEESGGADIVVIIAQ